MGKKDPTEEQPEEVVDATAFFADLKKKKKKKKTTEVVQEQPPVEEPPVAEEQPPAEEPPVAEEEPQDEQLDDELFSLKKKKKKKVVINEDLNVTEDAAPIETIHAQEAAVSEDPLLDSFGKKKKKKKINLDEFAAALSQDSQDAPADAPAPSTGDSWAGSDRDYTYGELLARVFALIRTNNPELQGEKRKINVVAPQVLREGSKKTLFANLVDFCRRIRRTPDHLVQFLFAELGTTGSIDGNQRLVIKGRFQQKQIENVLKRYIVEYVTCKTCKSAETILTKENRLFFLQCESCNSSRSVSAIKTGFMAQTSRRAQRNAAG